MPVGQRRRAMKRRQFYFLIQVINCRSQILSNSFQWSSNKTITQTFTFVTYSLSGYLRSGWEHKSRFPDTESLQHQIIPNGETRCSRKADFLESLDRLSPAVLEGGGSDLETGDVKPVGWSWKRIPALQPLRMKNIFRKVISTWLVYSELESSDVHKIRNLTRNSCLGLCFLEVQILKETQSCLVRGTIPLKFKCPSIQL